MIHTYEATAQLAAYAFEYYSSEIATLAGELALGQQTEPAAALDSAHELSETRRVTFADWLSNPTTANKIESRVVLQEQGEAHIGQTWPLRTKLASPLGLLSVGPFRRGSQAVAMNLSDRSGNKLMAKTPLGEPQERGRAPVTIADRVNFVESRIRKLPALTSEINSEQARGISYGGLVISTRVPGKQLYKLGQRDLQKITDDHLIKAVTDLTTMSHAGIRQDGNGANTHFDPQHGFGFFDPLEGDASLRWALWSNMQDLGRGLAIADGPRSTCTPGCIALRHELFDRLKALAPLVPDETRPFIDELVYKPGSF